MVPAWANANNMVSGQVKVDDRSNEITAVPKLPRLLDLEGSQVTIDAMDAQKDMARDIIGAKVDYLLALKGDQSKLKDGAVGAFTRPGALEKAVIDKKVGVGHGRIEERTCYALSAGHISADGPIKWKGPGDYRERYYISSLQPMADKINHAVQAHWGIGTKLHWVLLSGKMNSGSEKDMPMKILPSQGILPSINSKTEKHSKEGSRPNVKRQDGRKDIYLKSLLLSFYAIAM